MNIATQLLKEALGAVRLVQEDWSQHLQRNNGDAHAEAAIRHVALLREDIEAYLAKQQVEQEPMSDDEKRYQYLRNRPLDTITSGGVFAGLTPENIVLNGDDLDKHIDDAIEAHYYIK
jgi:hypothetical protein